MTVMLQTALRDMTTGAPIPFTGLSIETTLSPAYATTKLVQRYKNVEEKAIEAVYTFPLPEGAVLLGVKARLGKTILEAEIKEKEKASKIYEAAIDKGHSAVLVEVAQSGLYTMNLGNLLPGEDAEIEALYADQNRWEGGKLRWRLPLTVAPRYGQSGLQPHQEPVTDVTVRHDATFTMVLGAGLATAAISSPSHSILIDKAGDASTISMKRGDFAMDRDLIIDIEVNEVVSSARIAKWNDEISVMASFIPKGEWTTEKKGRNLKIVLDCSESMSGDSIGAARRAVEAVLAELNGDDYFNLVRFGSSYELMFPGQVLATRENLRLAEDCVRLIDANMGGTEMKLALDAAYRSAPEGSDNNEMTAGDVILITDGQTWRSDEIIAAAKISNHRLFTIGVGSAVQETMLRGMARETGGAAEFVVPGEAVKHAIINQFRRVRSGIVSDIKLEWPGEPKILTGIGKSIFAGDAIHLGAFYEEMPEGKIKLSFKAENGKRQTETISLKGTELLTGDIGKTEIRLVAAGVLADIRTDEKKARKWAIAYELISEYTSLVVVRKNAKKDRPGEIPELRIVPQMAPAGWAMLNRSRPMRMRSAVDNPIVASGASSAPIASPVPAAGARSFGGPIPTPPQRVFEDSSDFAEAILPEAPVSAPRAGSKPRSMMNFGRARGFFGGNPNPRPFLDRFDNAFIANLEKAVVSGKAIATIADLTTIGLDQDAAKILKGLTATHKEAEVVVAFIVALFDRYQPSMAARVVIARLKSSAKLDIIRKLMTA